MKSLSLITVMVLSLLLSGCSGKKYFEPSETFSASKATTYYGGNIVDISRKGGTLSTGHYVGRDGESNIKLEDGYRFLSESSRYILSVNSKGVLAVVSKKTKKTTRAVAMHIPVVSATISNGLVAYILNNNTFGIYKISSNKKLVESRSERTYSIDTRAASPMFIDNLVIMPMLDGKLIIVDTRNTNNTKVVYISSEKVFNNVIHLSRLGNTMVASTPKRVMTLGTYGKSEYRANISEVAVSKGKIYIFTKEGEIISLSSKMKVISKVKHKFAHYSVATAFGGKVYALDQQGSLIVMDSNLKKSKVYELGNIDMPPFISGSKLYKDGIIVDLSKLGYE